MKKIVVVFFIFLSLLLIGCGDKMENSEPTKEGHFTPSQQIPGIGVQRADMTDGMLTQRIKQMIECQTFVILRNPEALPGAERVLSPELQKIFRLAAKDSGFPQTVLEAICFIESWGNPKAQSPTGPKGIGQIARGTAKEMGLKIKEATKYRIVKQKVVSKVRPKSAKGKKSSKTRTIVRYRTKKIPYKVVVLDERLKPEKAIPAMGKYLAGLTEELGGQGLAIFAYHCGESGVRGLLRLANEAKGFTEPITVPQMFFRCSPAFNAELYTGIKKQMARDYSPTYWFRIQRAVELLALYRKNHTQFKALWLANQNPVDPENRAASRLPIWIGVDGLKYKNLEDLQRGDLVRIPDNPDYFGFSPRTEGQDAIGEKDLTNQELYLQTAPAAIGAVAYIAFETRRLCEASGEEFIPLETTSLVRTEEYQRRVAGTNVNARTFFPSHCSGKVFDISYLHLPPGEKEILEFVLNDMEWAGYLDVTKESKASMTFHIGISPSSEEFFSAVYQEAKEKK